MKITKIGPISLYDSAPGSPVQGYLTVEGTTSDQTVDVLWAYGNHDAGTGSFSIMGYLIGENVTFSGYMSSQYGTGAFATPEAPGTWDLLGILANNIEFDGTNFIIEGQHSGVYVLGAWTISSAAQLQIADVGVQGA